MTRSIWGDDFGMLHTPPARRRRFPFVRLVLGIVALAGAGVGLYYYDSVVERPFWGVQRIELRGNRSVSESDLLASLDLQPGMPWWFAVSKLGDRTSPALPRVAEAHVSFAPPAGLRVEAVERSAILLFTTDKTLGLSEDGTVLPLEPGFDRIDLPYLTGRLPVCAPGTRLELTEAGDWWTQLARVESELPDLWESISQVDYQGARDFQVYFRDQHILLWDSHRNAHLWEQVPLVLSRLRLDALAGDAVLDMRFKDRIVVRVPGEKLLEEEELEDPLEVPADTEEASDHAREDHGTQRDAGALAEHTLAGR